MTQRYCEKCGGKDFVDSTAGHFCHPVYVQPIEEKKEGQLGEECCVCFGEKAFDDGIVHCDCKCHKSSEEKKDWEEEYRKRIKASGWYGHLQTLGQRSLEEFIGSEIMFIEGLIEEEREKWRLKNAGLYRQLFAEMKHERTFTAKELWEMFADYAPLFTEEQKEALKDNLYNSIMEKK